MTCAPGPWVHACQAGSIEPSRPSQQPQQLPLPTPPTPLASLSWSKDARSPPAAFRSSRSRNCRACTEGGRGSMAPWLLVSSRGRAQRSLLDRFGGSLPCGKALPMSACNPQLPASTATPAPHLQLLLAPLGLAQLRLQLGAARLQGSLVLRRQRGQEKYNSDEGACWGMPKPCHTVLSSSGRKNSKQHPPSCSTAPAAPPPAPPRRCCPLHRRRPQQLPPAPLLPAPPAAAPAASRSHRPDD